LENRGFWRYSDIFICHRMQRHARDV
jgi:hypothetical protein